MGVKMKKFIFALAVAFLVFSCDNEDVETNPFVGTWENEDGTRLVFTKETVTDYEPDGNIFWKGSYTYDDKYITINWEYKVEQLEVWGDTFTPWYTFEDDELIFGGTLFKKVSENH